MTPNSWQEAAAGLASELAASGIRDPQVLDAIRKVPRHRFVPEHLRPWAYHDRPLPIGKGQTISQPYIVALSVEALAPQPGVRVLEVGTGSGYQAAILAELGADVFTIERYQELASEAQALLGALGYSVHQTVGDGSKGWPEYAPFAGIVVAAGAPDVPRSLEAQLAPHGRLVIPVGDRSHQELWLFTVEEGRRRGSVLCPCAFVPLVGEEGW